MKFKIKITEKLERIVTVDADTIEDALSKVENDYASCKIVLTETDFTNFTIEEAKDA
jgi:hypothetical protein